MYFQKYQIITAIFRNWVLLESLLNSLSLLDITKISTFLKVDKMYLLLYWVTYAKQKSFKHFIGLVRLDGPYRVTFYNAIRIVVRSYLALV